MATYQVVVCSVGAPSPDAIALNGTGPGAFTACGPNDSNATAWVVSAQMPDGVSFYGLPNIDLADAQAMTAEIAIILVTVWVIKQAMKML